MFLCVTKTDGVAVMVGGESVGDYGAATRRAYDIQTKKQASQQIEKFVNTKHQAQQRDEDVKAAGWQRETGLVLMVSSSVSAPSGNDDV